MPRRRWLVGLVVALVLIAGSAAVVWMAGRAPAVSSVGGSTCLTADQTCLRFPAISAQNLPGDSFALPQDFKGDPVLVIVAFDENQQTNAASWLPLARELAAAHPGFGYYDVAVFPTMSAPMRGFIRAGMNVTIVDADVRAVTITAFLDNRDRFLADLHIADTKSMQIFLLDGQGNAIWRGVGVYSDPQAADLRTILRKNT